MRKRKPSKNAAAVVTGAGSGIGRSFALDIARRGGRVVCSDIDVDTATETAAMIQDQGGEAYALRCNVADLTEVEALAREAASLLRSPVDLVINNAGVGAGGRRIGDIPIEDWQWALGVNMWGVIHGCHVFVPKLRALGRGGIINVASTASFAAAPTMGPYNVGKAAALALTETLAAEMEGAGVSVTALCPTFVKTNIVQAGRIDAASSQLAQRLMEWTGISADKVARVTLDALDRGELYVMPQFDAQLIWRMKRYMPRWYARGAGFVHRLSGSDHKPDPKII